MKISAIDVNGDGVPDSSKDLVVDGVTEPPLPWVFPQVSIIFGCYGLRLGFRWYPRTLSRRPTPQYRWRDFMDRPRIHRRPVWSLAPRCRNRRRCRIGTHYRTRRTMGDLEHDGALLSEQSIKTKGAAPPCVATLMGMAPWKWPITWQWLRYAGIEWRTTVDYPRG